MEDANNDEDEDAHSDQRDGRQQHAVARSQVQLSAPAKEREKDGVKRNEDPPYAVLCLVIDLFDRKNNVITKWYTLAETVF